MAKRSMTSLLAFLKNRGYTVPPAANREKIDNTWTMIKETGVELPKRVYSKEEREKALLEAGVRVFTKEEREKFVRYLAEKEKRKNPISRSVIMSRTQKEMELKKKARIKGDDELIRKFLSDGKERGLEEIVDYLRSKNPFLCLRPKQPVRTNAIVWLREHKEEVTETSSRRFRRTKE